MAPICALIILPSYPFETVHCHCFDASTEVVWYYINLKGTYNFESNDKRPDLDDFMSKTENYKPVKKTSTARNVYRPRDLVILDRLRKRFSSTQFRQISNKGLTDVTNVAYMSTYETTQQI